MTKYGILVKRKGDFMAFKLGRRCSLCGGRLDSKLRCLECGLDNTKNDSMYHEMINRNNCENEPLTHVHHEEPNQKYQNIRYRRESVTESDKQPDLQALKERLQKKYANQTGTDQNSNQQSNKYQGSIYTGSTYSAGSTKASSGRKNNKLGFIIFLIIFLSGFLPAIVGLVMGFADQVSNMASVMREEPVEVYTYETSLASGFYTVGIHLPVGYYDIELEWGDYTYIDVYDIESDTLYLYSTALYYLDWENPRIEDIYLEEGTILKLTANTSIRLMSNDVWDTDVKMSSNPLEDQYEVQDYAVAGVDFPVGIYDIYYAPADRADSSDCYVIFDMRDSETLEIILGETIFVDSDMISETYCNVPFTAGSMISGMDLESLILIPSQGIDTELQEIIELSEIQSLSN